MMEWRAQCEPADGYPLRIRLEGPSLLPAVIFGSLVLGAGLLAYRLRARDEDADGSAGAPEPSRRRPPPGQMEAREADLVKRVDALERLEHAMRTANVRQIALLYDQMHARTLEALGLAGIKKEIAMAAILGESNAEIAKRMGLTENSVKHHLRGAFEQTGSTSRQSLRAKVKGMLGLGDGAEGPGSQPS